MFADSDHDIVWLDKGLDCSLRGKLDFSEIRALVARIYSDSRSDAMEFQLFDFTGVTELSLGRDELKIIAALERAASYSTRGLRVAYVVPHRVLIEPMQRFLMTPPCEDWEKAIFSNRLDAIKWLSKETHTASPLRLNTAQERH